jgi:adenine-specific DNA-methyltransferase
VPTNLEKLRGLLQELFQLDQADLDFGLYRIMNQKRDEVVRFLDRDLLPQVQEDFSHYQSADKATIQAELKKVEEQVRGVGMNPNDSPKVTELKQKLAEAAVDVVALENEVFSHLFNFFRRYYSEGDFLPLRRYKEGVYAIPYEGEEVKLHWANADQYYVKSSEYFKDYVFTMPTGKRIRVHLVAASTEQDNKVPALGRERRFFLCKEKPVYELDGELFIRFEYREAEEKQKQELLNKTAIERILKVKGLEDWMRELSKPAPTEKNKGRTVLEKHLTQYTAKNTFDYFVHRDLGGFLRRELDFFIKNEVMHLDDVENETVPRVEQYLSKIKVIRKIAHKIIAFLEQLENFQKKLWLKKKLVVETNYCITLDRVPEDLYSEIAKNDAQREEWVRLFAIDEIKKDGKQPAFSSPLKVEFLKSHANLILDTRYFSRSFRDRVIASLGNVDSDCDGVFMHAENFQALLLLHNRLHDSIKCIYIDPPYNTGSSAILYKNSYKHSSWCTLMRDRLSIARRLLKNDGALFASIDKTERAFLEYALDDVFQPDNHIEELIWTQATANSQLPNYSTNHEYVEVYARDRKAVESDKDMFREPKPGYAEVMELLSRLGPEYPSCDIIQSEIKKLYEEHLTAYREEVEGNGKEWDEDAKRQDPWRGIYPYNRGEYRDGSGNLVAEADARKANASIWVWREISPAAPASKQSSTTKDPKHHNYRYYKPKHPVTGKPCPHPRTGWKFPYQPDPDSPSRRSFVDLDNDHRIVWGDDETKVPQTKGFLQEVETNIGTSVFYAYNDGEAELQRMFGESGLFLSPKSSEFVRKFVNQTTRKDDWFVDFFGGSGSSGHAVITQNREDGGRRKQILVEVGDHFDNLLLPRIKKAAYSSGWQTGKPTDRKGISCVFKYIRLESYEDALNNLELKRTDQQQKLLDDDKDLREQYVLSYMLDVESRGSGSLLNVERFRNPDHYQLRIERNGETKLVNVDLVETFNWLLGLTVKHIDAIRGVRVVSGTNPENERVLVLWRNADELNNDALDKWFEKQGYSTRDLEFDLIYVNGDNNLENLRRSDQTWKVRLVEEEFHRLMFDVEDV